MFPFAVLGLILWILLLLWRINTKTVAMPSGCGPPAVEDDMPATQSPDPGEHSLSTVPTTSPHNEDKSPQASGVCVALKVKKVDTEVNSEKPSSLASNQKSTKTKVPMLSSGPEARERLKFILGASEDNSSDEEPLLTKRPSSASQPPTSTLKSAPPPASSAVPQSSSSGIK